MPDQTPTPAEDLAALDRVTELAARYGVAFAGTDVRLRGCIEQEGDRLHALGATLADLIPVLFGNDEDAIGSLVARAIASVGAEIVWPSPDSGEVADRSAGDDTAPGIDTAVTEGEWPFPSPPGTYTMTSSGDLDGDAIITDDGRLLVQQYSLAGSKARWSDLTDIYRGGTSWRFAKHEPVFRASEAAAAEPTAREKILAEVAASTAPAQADLWHPRNIRDEAVTLARIPDGDPFGRPVPSRANMIGAAAMLVLAVERLDGAA